MGDKCENIQQNGLGEDAGPRDKVATFSSYPDSYPEDLNQGGNRDKSETSHKRKTE